MSLEMCNECEKDLTNEYCIYVCEDCHLQVVKGAVACQGKIDELQAENARLLSENAGLKEENKYFLELLKTEDVRRGAESMARVAYTYGQGLTEAEYIKNCMEQWELENNAK